MELLFDISQQVATGNNPAGVHFEENTAQVFYTGENARLYAEDTSTPNGSWDNREFSSPLVVAPDLNIEYLTLRRISRYGVYGSWHSDNRHRFAIYGVDFEVGDYIEDGSIEFSINNPIATMSINLNNPNQTFMNEEYSIVSPGSKVQFTFKSGDSVPYPMGQFYVDRGGFTVLDDNIDISGRNTVGKVLKDQTFDEKDTYPLNNLKTVLSSILDNAGVLQAKYFIADTSNQVGMKFPVNMNFLDGITEVLKTASGWKLQELLDGSVAIGPSDYSKFDQPSKYIFLRNKEVWSRKIERADMDTYRRVCVHTNDFSVKVYRNTTGFEGWSLGVQKTLYVQVPDGTSQADCEAYADDLAQRLSSVGIVETFFGPFRPHIQCGDEAEIINQEGKARLIGLITNVKHRFGKSGFSTEFTVDSGGQIGKGRISDLIERINQKNSVSNATRLYV